MLRNYVALKHNNETLAATSSRPVQSMEQKYLALLTFKTPISNQVDNFRVHKIHEVYEECHINAAGERGSFPILLVFWLEMAGGATAA